MSNERNRLFNVLKQIPKDELDQHHRELRQLEQTTGERHNQVFEVDGQEHVIPAEAIHDYIQEQRIKHGFPALMSAVRGARMGSELPFAGRIPAMPKKEESDSDMDGYYWDDPNRGYEHMNPEAVKDRVLNKKR